MSRTSIVLSLASLLICPALVAQTGAAKRKVPQYKRVHQKILKAILNGKHDKARRALQQHIERQPEDAESYFMQTLLRAAEGKTRAADAAMQKALDLGLPPGRFVSGPRRLLAPLADTRRWKHLVAEFAHKPVHGPMLGHLTDKTVKVWLRTANPARVRVTARVDGGSTGVTADGRTTATADFTTVVTVEGLKPATRYEYSVQIDDGAKIAGGRFQTHPERGHPCHITVAFGGGAGFVPTHERMWDTIRGFSPQMLLLLGDNVYIDAPKSRAMQRYCYYRRQSRQEFRQMIRSVAVYSIWDDHDFGTNDCFGGPMPDKPPWKKKVHAVFRQNWANPAFGGTDVPGCFYSFKVGNIFFVMLDSRYYRDNPKKKERPSMLGFIQMAWLRGVLSNATATFKIICSPVPWNFGSKGDSKDTWNGFREERKEIFDFFAEARLEGLVLLSADRHRTDVWKIDREETYPLHEFMSSRLTNQHVHPKMKAAEFSFNEKQSFGLLDLDTTDEDPKLTFKAITIDGEVVHTKVLRFSDLCYH